MNSSANGDSIYPTALQGLMPKEQMLCSLSWRGFRFEEPKLEGVSRPRPQVCIKVEQKENLFLKQKPKQ